MKTLVIAGASGTIGHHLIKHAHKDYKIKVLSRGSKGSNPNVTLMTWNPHAAKDADEKALQDVRDVLEGTHAVINLAGASIGNGRLDKAHKRLVWQSRMNSTETLVEALKRCEQPPAVWFQASAVGYYGDRGEEELTEEASPQPGYFLSDLVQAWEKSAEPATSLSRLLIGRIGLVLAKHAPAWKRYLLPIHLGLGGPLGSGKQWYAWIDADDLARLMLELIANPNSQGVYNLVAPNPIRQHDLSKKAAARLSRPAFMPLPAFALRLLLGETADALLLSSSKVLPTKLLQEGFHFEYPDIDQELNKLLS